MGFDSKANTSMAEAEDHAAGKLGWLRAAVLGANDGIVSTASLIAGVASSDASPKSILVAGIAGLVAGSLSMAAGEYVSVSSQADAEGADLARERTELIEQPDFELQELTDIYTKRGVEPALARHVAKQLMANDALATHAREELGITEVTTARPIIAATASATSFAIGAAVPLLAAIASSGGRVTLVVTAASSLVCLAALGAVGARIGGANVWRATARVTFWGALAMALTAAIGHLSGAAV
jgi:VIT1/CCC1 family predicted Fe2+/Mn2+ transporter